MCIYFLKLHKTSNSENRQWARLLTSYCTKFKWWRQMLDYGRRTVYTWCSGEGLGKSIGLCDASQLFEV